MLYQKVSGIKKKYMSKLIRNQRRSKKASCYWSEFLNLLELTKTRKLLSIERKDLAIWIASIISCKLKEDNFVGLLNILFEEPSPGITALLFIFSDPNSSRDYCMLNSGRVVYGSFASSEWNRGSAASLDETLRKAVLSGEWHRYQQRNKLSK